MGFFGTALLKQTIVYWAPKDAPDKYGQPEFEDPVEVACRCDPSDSLQVDGQGRTFSSMISVMTQTELKRQGWIVQSTLAAVGSQSPQEVEAYEIVQVRKTPSVKGNRTVYASVAGR